MHRRSNGLSLCGGDGGCRARLEEDVLVATKVAESGGMLNVETTADTVERLGAMLAASAIKEEQMRGSVVECGFECVERLLLPRELVIFCFDRKPVHAGYDVARAQLGVCYWDLGVWMETVLVADCTGRDVGRRWRRRLNEKIAAAVNTTRRVGSASDHTRARS